MSSRDVVSHEHGLDTSRSQRKPVSLTRILNEHGQSGGELAEIP